LDRSLELKNLLSSQDVEHSIPLSDFRAQVVGKLILDLFYVNQGVSEVSLGSIVGKIESGTRLALPYR
jgi:hypothetical protein